MRRGDAVTAPSETGGRALGELPRDREQARRDVEEFSQAIAGETLMVHALADTLRGAKKFIEQAAREYAERFLYELIQNAYDANPSGFAGTVKVILDVNEGEHGTLYVANTGVGFRDCDFRSICEIAQSSKPPGQGIGNKGVGFKSVLQVSEWPEIYSRSLQSADAFDGYCFTFARPTDVVRLASGDAEKARLLADRLSPYGLPVSIDPVGAVLRELADEGFASVIRLPLRNPQALVLARRQLDEITTSPAPILLFLDRLEALALETREPDRTPEPGRPPTWIGRRKVVPLDAPKGVELAEVDLGSAGRFLTVSRRLDPRDFLEAIVRSIDARLVDEEWRDWDGEAFVSIALPIDGAQVDGRLYCYLPMGHDEHSPLNGHLNAPFAVTLARQSLVPSVPLNEFLFDAAAAAAALAAPHLRNHQHGRSLVPDLIAWRGNHAARVVSAFSSLGTPIANEPLLPTASQGAWGTFASAYRWTVDLTTLTAAAIAAATDDQILDPTLGPARSDRLSAFAETFTERTLEPDRDTVAGWAEAVARSLAAQAKRRTFDPHPWSGLYDDLAAYFRDPDARALRGRALLIDDDLRLQVTWGGTEGQDSSIFFPLREMSDSDEPTRDATIPKSLGQHLAYVHAGVPWTRLNPETKRNENRPGRDFLDRTGLVRMPKTRHLLERISRVLERRRDKQLHADALRLVYNLSAGRLDRQEPALDSIHLRVPTASGAWIPAAAARFSDAWPDTLGPVLGQLLRQGAGLSDDLVTLSDRLLAPPAEFGFRLDSLDGWTAFLRAIGVRDGLWPEIVETASPMAKSGWWWKTSGFASVVPLTDEERTAWAVDLVDSPSTPKYPYTTYQLDGPIMRILGSADYDALPSLAREAFGRLIVAGLADWPGDAFRVRISRPRVGGAADPVELPSPAVTFLRRARWMPVTRRGEAGAEEFVTPAQAWHYRDEEGGDAQPTFMPLLLRGVRAALDASPRALKRATDLGVHVWNNPVHALARLRELTRVFQELDVPDTLVANFRKACERTWTALGRQHRSGGVLPLRNEDGVIVSRRGRLGTFVLGEGDEVLHVLVDEDRLTAAVLDALDVPVLQADPQDGEVLAAILRPLLAERLRPIRAAEVGVLVDGVTVDESEGVPLIDKGREWLADLVALTLEFKASAFNRQHEQRIRASIEILRAIRLHPGVTTAITMGSRDVALPSHVRRVFAIADAVRPRIAFEGTTDPFDWTTLQLLAPKIGELVGASNALENAVIVLGRSLGGGLLTPPTDLDYSAAFEQPVDRVVEVRRAQRGVIVGLLYFLRPIVHLYLGGEDLIGQALASDSPPTDPGELVSLLEPFAERFPAGTTLTDLMEAATTAESLAQLRERLGIGYAVFNASLRALAPDYAPIQNAEGHSFAFAAYLTRQLADLQRDLRDRFLPVFDAGDVPTKYAAAARELARAQLRRERHPDDETPLLGPDPSWLDAFDVPSDSALHERIRAWIGAVAPGDASASGAPPVEEIRAANARTLTSFVRRAAVTISVWARKQSEVSPPGWIAAGDSATLTDAFRAAALLDFRALDDAAIIEWARRLGLWPSPLPDSVDADVLGVSPDDLAAQGTDDERRRWERALARRTVALDGRPVALDTETAPELIDSIRAGITEEFLSATRRRQVLAGIDPRTRRGGAGGGGTRGGGISRPTSDQTELVGFMGELVAFEWLKRQYSVGPEAWRSGNRRFVFTDDDGDDALGYDFEVIRRRPLLFEVKATTTDNLSFEMSEKELRVAGDNASNDRYRILFIGRVNDSSARSLVVLPNPLSALGQGRYRVVGRGIQYHFQVAEPGDERKAPRQEASDL